MDSNALKIDKKIAKIMANLYLRHYSFADIIDYINGKDIIEIFYSRLDEHIEKMPEKILDGYKVTKEGITKIIKRKDAKGIAILKFKTNDIIENYEKEQNLSKKEISTIKDLKNDIEEMQMLLSKKERNIHFSEEEKNTSMIYQMLNSKDYKKLKEIKLDI